MESIPSSSLFCCFSSVLLPFCSPVAAPRPGARAGKMFCDGEADWQDDDGMSEHRTCDLQTRINRDECLLELVVVVVNGVPAHFWDKVLTQ